MSKSPAFQFYPRDWLGDPEIMLMDWDAKAMHLHCICIAWLHTDACALPDDDALLCRWLNIENDADWQERLKPQIFAAWELSDGHWIQKRLKREKIKQLQRSDKMKSAAKSRWNKEKNTDANAMQKHMQMQCSSSSSSTAVNKEKNKQKKKNEYSEFFEKVWAQYPKREGNNSKADAYKAWQARLRAGVREDELADGVSRYAAYVRAKGLEGTEYVKQAKTFFGPGNDWSALWQVNNKPPKRNGAGTAEDIAREYQQAFGKPPPPGKTTDEVRMLLAQKRDKQRQWWNG